MGFLSNMKKNLTGSWAQVELVVPQPCRRGEATAVRVDVTVADNDITVTSVVVEVRCVEVVDLRSAASAAGWNQGGASTSMPDEREEQLHSEEIVLARDQTLAAGTSTSFEGKVQLRATDPPSARGRHAEFRWSARARLDMKGNDPDSGWEVLEVI